VNNAKALIRVVFPETPRGPVNQDDHTGIHGSMVSLYVYYRWDPVRVMEVELE